MATSAAQRRGLKRRPPLQGAELDRQAIELFDTGKYSYQQIADIQGCSISTAYARVWRTARRIVTPALEQFREHENAKLDAIEMRLVEIITAKHPLVSNGKRFDDLVDDGPVIAALNSWLRVIERRAKLNGLDAPQLHDLKVTNDEDLNASIERLIAGLTGRDRAGHAPPAIEG